MNLKKLPYYLLLILLTLGASLIIGLLSFGGFYVIWPSIMLASFAFILSVAYEGEVYFQNIKGALNKLFKPNYIKIELAKTFLKDYFPHHRPRSEWPQFFIDYELALYQLHAFEHQSLDKLRRIEKRKIEKKLSNLEALFTRHLNLKNKNTSHLSKDEQVLHEYLTYYSNPTNTQIKTIESLPEKYQALLKSRQTLFLATRAFSLLTALFMSFGTTYLLLETFAVIPFLAALPFTILPILIIPMAVISGVAYGLLTYNTITNIITHDRIRTRFNTLRNDIKANGLTWRNGFMIATALTLGSLAVMLTICTAGTWWTIVKETAPLFKWMLKIPAFVMGVFTPVVTSTAALAFNLENSCESLDMLDEAMQEKFDLKKSWANLKNKFEQLRQRENLGQLLNPFRIILTITILPLRLILFLGHLFSIGLTADRVPKLSKTSSALLGFISEFFEDMHYFIKHKPHQHDTRSLLNERLSGEHDHQHDNDLPTRILNFIALPIYVLSALWNYACSQFNPNERRLKFTDLYKQTVEPTPSFAMPMLEQNISTLKTTRDHQTSDDVNIKIKKSIQNTSIAPSTSNCPCCLPIVSTNLQLKQKAPLSILQKDVQQSTLPIQKSVSHSTLKSFKAEPPIATRGDIKNRKHNFPQSALNTDPNCPCCPPNRFFSVNTTQLKQSNKSINTSTPTFNILQPPGFFSTAQYCMESTPKNKIRQVKPKVEPETVVESIPTLLSA
jgi:hypothetical protein